MKMRILWLILPAFLILAATASPHGKVEIEDNDFAEFEDPDEPMQREAKTTTASPSHSENKNLQEDIDEEEVVEEEEDEGELGPEEGKGRAYRSAQDVEEDEFGIMEEEDEMGEGGEGGASTLEGREAEPSGGLRFADVPAHLRSNWSNYQVEIVMLIGLAAYLSNYLWGRAKNGELAEAWLAANRSTLEAQFALVGDDGTSSSSSETSSSSSAFMRETDSTFNLWCSGRAGVEGMLVSLKLLKRQDLVSMIGSLMRPKTDQIVIKVDLEPGEMDSFVFAVGNRKVMARLGKEMADLSQYCTEKKNSASLGLPASFTLFSESMEASSAMLQDPKILAALEKLEPWLEYVHFSDQYTGPKPAEGETQCAKAAAEGAARSVILAARVPAEAEAEAAGARLLALLFYWLEKLRRFRLSREGKAKAERNRATAAERAERSTHSQRQEAAQARREERVRERKERLMAEEDPEKQRRLQREEQKREAKKKTPKMKQLKIKAM